MKSTIPAGYWQDANGNLTPESKVKPIDKLRTELVIELCEKAKIQRDGLIEFKLTAMSEVGAFVDTSVEQYGVKSGGRKGNVTLTSYDGQYKVIRHMQDKIVFGEQLAAAKALIDECVHEWAENANDNIKALVNHAFQTDNAGEINTGRVLSLRQLDITDSKWLAAMQAIADSMKTASTKPYLRLYERNDATGEYEAISLDLAAV